MPARKQPAAVRPAPQQTRLRWWAVALPVAAFIGLLSLLLSPAAEAGQARAGGMVSHPLVDQALDILPKLLLVLFGS